MSKALDKRTFDVRLYDINCSDLLDTGEVITFVMSLTSDQGGVTFAAPIVNTAPVTYPGGRIAAIGKVIQVQIIGGAIPIGSPFLVCTVRARFATNINPALEATVGLRLIDNPIF